MFLCNPYGEDFSTWPNTSDHSADKQQKTMLEGAASPLAPVVPEKGNDESSYFIDPDFWPARSFNPGFVPPRYLTEPKILASIRPPPIVKTFEQRLGELSPQQLEAFREIKQRIKYSQEPVLEGKNGEVFCSPEECDDWRLVRLLFARQFHVDKAIKMLVASLAWERKTKPATVVCRECVRTSVGLPSNLSLPRDRVPVNSGVAHFMQFCGWDLQHRPVIYVSYKWAHPKLRLDGEGAMEHAVETFETAKKVMPVGVEQWISITDFVSYSLWSDGSAKAGPWVVQMLANHFPERLGMQILVDPPTTFWVFFKALSPFVDERTKQKLRFVYTTGSDSNVDDVFPTIFPAHLATYLAQCFRYNKQAYEDEKKKST